MFDRSALFPAENLARALPNIFLLHFTLGNKEVASSWYSQEEVCWVRISVVSAFLPQYIQVFIQNIFRDPWCPALSLFNFFSFLLSFPTIIFVSVSGGFCCWGFYFFPLHNLGRAFSIRILNPSFFQRKTVRKCILWRHHPRFNFVLSILRFYD